MSKLVLSMINLDNRIQNKSFVHICVYYILYIYIYKYKHMHVKI